MFTLKNLKPHTRVQLHCFKSHSASNLNRDDLGRPKEMMFGGASRLRISSQCIKRAMRTGEVMDAFRAYAHTQYGCAPMTRTRNIETLLVRALEARGIAADKAMEGAKAVSATLSKKKKGDEVDDKGKGKSKGKNKESDPPENPDAEPDIEKTQLIAISDAEVAFLADQIAAVEDKAVANWVASVIAHIEAHRKARDSRFLRGDLSPEVALFGRMVTSDLFSSIDSAIQVAHAMTVHEVRTERDYWTGVDDLTSSLGETGSGMIDVRRFGSGVFYQYACIDVDLLLSNLRQSHGELAEGQIRALCRDLINAVIFAFVGQNPTGSQTGFASHAMADGVCIEVGGAFPHSAAAAFEKPVTHKDGYSSGAKARFAEWLVARRAMYGDEAIGQIRTLGLDADSLALPDLVEQSSGAALALAATPAEAEPAA